jgi:hypothetical protein
LFPEPRVQPPDYFDHNGAWARRISENRHRLDKVSDRFSSLRISRMNAFGQGIRRVAQCRILKAGCELGAEIRIVPGALAECSRWRMS